MFKLSIAIPVFNNWYYTRYCLDNFSNLNENDYEIVIVDNNSTDQTEENIKPYLKHNIKCIKNLTNTGFSFASNQAYEESSGDIVMFLNNDIRIKDKNYEWLDKFVDDVTNYSNSALFGPTGGLVDKNFRFEYETDNPDDKINYMSGWCLSAKRKVWQSLVLPGQKGPFDSKNFISYFDDTDCSFRATKQNIEFKIYPLPMSHIGRQTSKLINTYKLYSNSKESFEKKWKKK